MKYLIFTACAVLLSACVSAPADLYGVHQAKPETQVAHYAATHAQAVPTEAAGKH